MITRRWFLTSFGAAAVAPLVPIPNLPAPQEVIKIPVEFGWTWYIPKDKIPPGSLGEIIRKTLRENTQMLADNVSRGNPLILKLTDKVNEEVFQLDLEYITPETQNERMKTRLQARLNGCPKERTLSPNPTPVKVDGEMFYYTGYENFLEKKHA